MSDLPGEEVGETTESPVGSEARDRSTTVIAVLALLIALGHVVYAFVRDHVLN